MNKHPTSQLPGIDNSQVIPSYPNLIKTGGFNRPRDKDGRFVKKTPDLTRGGMISGGIGSIIENHPNDKWGFIPLDKLTRFTNQVKPHKEKKNHNITMRAILWFTIGVLSGVIFEMIVKLGDA